MEIKIVRLIPVILETKLDEANQVVRASRFEEKKPMVIKRLTPIKL